MNIFKTDIIGWLLDKWFKKYDSRYKELFEELSNNVADNYKQITAGMQLIEQQVIPRLDKIKEIELKHYKELRQRVEDTNAIARHNSEQLREIHKMISEFYEHFRKKFPD